MFIPNGENLAYPGIGVWIPYADCGFIYSFKMVRTWSIHEYGYELPMTIVDWYAVSKNRGISWSLWTYIIFWTVRTRPNQNMGMNSSTICPWKTCLSLHVSTLCIILCCIRKWVEMDWRNDFIYFVITTYVSHMMQVSRIMFMECTQEHGSRRGF